jgi:di/tricarboxylate transporter
LRAIYEAIDWPVIVLLGALIPVAGAMETNGTAGLVASVLLDGIAQGHAVIGLVVILVVSMTLSDLMNNAATAAIMCPVAIGAAGQIRLRTRYGINLLAVSRRGRRSVARLRNMNFQAGDVLLLQGPEDAIGEFANETRCAPLATRALRIPDKRKTILASLIMLFAVAGAALGLLPAAISFAAGVLATMALRTLPLRAIYEAIDWPVIVLLGALIPVAGAMETTGTAGLVASVLLDGIAQGHAIIGLVVILVVSMTLSDLMNNAATAAIMCPVAIGAAGQLGVSADPYLMAVAVGASCAFLTPIGHQNNTLILGPGGFRFGDYWRLGLPLEVLVVLVAVPMLLWVWPL